MLSEADLQGLRGLPFDRLLLQVWPRGRNANRKARCRGCESVQAIHARGLCSKCHGRWWREQASGAEASIDAGPARGDKSYLDALMAKRIGVGLGTLRQWRKGRQVPWLATIRLAAPNLEQEFGVPACFWIDAVAISNYARGYVLCESGNAFVNQQTRAPVFSKEAAGAVGEQYGYWLVMSLAGTRKQSGRYAAYAKVKCLLCGSVLERRLSKIRRGDGTKCLSCTRRLEGPSTVKGKVSKFTGVCHESSSSQRPWRVLTTGLVPRSFASEIDAARYYDACMYERYGHTLFLNFPGEYDRSNDPVFVPAGKASA